jgi:hypothetical protein
MRRKILMGVLALALPTASVALVGSNAAFAKKPPPNPVNCTGVSDAVSFNPVLSMTGTPGPKTATGQVTFGALSLTGCTDSLGNSGTGTGVPNTLTTTASKVGKGKSATYATGYCPSFLSAGTGKTLKKLVITINWGGGLSGSSTFNIKKAGAASLSPEIVFQLNGKVSGAYAAKKAQLLAGISVPDTTNIEANCAPHSMAGLTVDSGSVSAF